MTVVVDASVVYQALVDDGPAGRWAERVLLSDFLVAPHLMPVEVTSILRRASLNGDISADAAAMAYADLLLLRVELFPFDPFAGRVWDLRNGLTSYDAWYVSLAEELEAPLATLDRKLTRATGVACEFLTSPE